MLAPTTKSVIEFMYDVDHTKDQNGPKLVRFLKSAEFRAHLELSTKIIHLLDEMAMAIGEMGSYAGTGIYSYSTISLTMRLKQYIITWNTLNEVVLETINISLDLGMDKKHINFDSIMTNSHVKRVGLRSIVSEFDKEMRVSHFKSLRNRIVHEGTLIDNELASLTSQLQSLHQQQGPGIWAKPLPVEDFEARMAELVGSIDLYAKEKARSLRQHLELTVKFYNSIVVALIPFVRERVLGKTALERI